MTFKEKLKKEVKEWLRALAFALVIVGLIFVFARPSFVIGPSMEPTLDDGSVVLVEKVSYLTGQPQAFEIVVTSSNLPWKFFLTKNIIKRVIGLPGDHLRISEGLVYVNGVLIDEEYIKEPYTRGDFDGLVPEGHYFIMGDNRGISNDSRSSEVGFVPREDIKGKVYFRVFPFGDLGPVQ